jgi:N6-adenosine-specific RNA methylase IME4
MEELMTMIQQDPELWEIVEKIKDEDADLEFFSR